MIIKGKEKKSKLMRKVRLGKKKEVMEIKGVEVGVDEEIEGEGESIGEVIEDGRDNIDNVIEEVKMRIDRMGDGGLEGLGDRERIGGGEGEMWRKNIGKLREGNECERDKKWKSDEDRDKNGKERNVNEEGWKNG